MANGPKLDLVCPYCGKSNLRCLVTYSAESDGVVCDTPKCPGSWDQNGKFDGYHAAQPAPPSADTVERVAKVLCEMHGEYPWDGSTAHAKEAYRIWSRAALTAARPSTDTEGENR